MTRYEIHQTQQGWYYFCLIASLGDSAERLVATSELYLSLNAAMCGVMTIQDKGRLDSRIYTRAFKDRDGKWKHYFTVHANNGQEVVRSNFVDTPQERDEIMELYKDATETQEIMEII